MRKAASRIRGKVLGAALFATMLVCLLPFPTTAATPSGTLAGVPIVVGMAVIPAEGSSAGGPGVAETSQVGFGGDSWYVIGFDGTGVESENDTITLIQQGRYTTNTFPFASSANNNKYAESQLLGQVNAALSAPPTGISFTSEENLWMIPRVLDDVAGTEVSGQKLWPLSGQEVLNVSHEVRAGGVYIGAGWWLRTPATTAGPDYVQYVTYDGAVELDNGDSSFGVNAVARSTRVAFKLDLTDLLFVSLADNSDKSALTSDTVLPTFMLPTGVGNNEDQMMKLTMITSQLKLDVSNITVNGNIIEFSYTTTAPMDIYDALSALVRAADGTVKYYGKLDEALKPTASVQIPSGLAEGDTLVVFIEKFSPASTTDLASAPVSLYKQPGPPTPAPELTQTQGPGSPQTGDTSNLPLWVLYGSIALAGLALCGQFMRKRLNRHAE